LTVVKRRSGGHGKIEVMNMTPIPRRRFLTFVVVAATAVPFSRAGFAQTAPPTVEVWKDSACGCCKEWMAHLRAAGFKVVGHDRGNVAARRKAGIGEHYGSCHTAFVEGYAIEGHVPAREIQRLLKERPNAIGLAVPGMPQGSPGMEQGRRPDPYTVLLLHRDGGSSAYAKYPG
jgi:hypothetical protein